jgi:predicted phage terminase large subunit-like protein
MSNEQPSYLKRSDPKDREAAAITARQDLYFFSRWMFLQRRGFLWQKSFHHKIMCDALMRVYTGECKRLIINVPPRYSKTELAVVNFIAWAMGKSPDSEFIHVSYSSDLAANNSANTKFMMMHEAYNEIFPNVKFLGTAQAHWKTTEGGVMYSAGTGGTLTGFGAGKHRQGFGGAIIIDDPHKASEARSDVIRKGVLDWFQTTLESRKNDPKQTPIILIMQRLHESDLAGWLLEKGNGEEWEHICFPAIQADGTALWDEKHTLEDLRRMEQANPYVFAGQYQQRPSPGEGGIFKPDQLQIVDAIPSGKIKWCRGWDFAATLDGDFTAGAKIGRLDDGRFIIADMVRIRCETHERDAAIKNTANRDMRETKISMPQDPGQAGKTQVIYLTRELSGYDVKSSPETGDKVTRAEPYAAQLNVGNVLMLRAPWNEQYINELRMFPNGTFDDQVDASSRAFSEVMIPRRSFFG